MTTPESPLQTPSIKHSNQVARHPTIIGTLTMKTNLMMTNKWKSFKILIHLKTETQIVTNLVVNWYFRKQSRSLHKKISMVKLIVGFQKKKIIFSITVCLIKMRCKRSRQSNFRKKLKKYQLILSSMAIISGEFLRKNKEKLMSCSWTLNENIDNKVKITS